MLIRSTIVINKGYRDDCDDVDDIDLSAATTTVLLSLVLLLVVVNSVYYGCNKGDRVDEIYTYYGGS